MHPAVKFAVAIAVVVVACACLAPAYIYLASEAVIQRRYPLPPVAEPVAPTPAMLARGTHLVQIMGCSDCHGANLEGRLLDAQTPLPVWSANLRRSAAASTDAGFERAVRRGIADGATTLWGMPSAEYTYISENDMAALLAYVRAQPPAGPAHPRPRFDRGARLALLEGRMEPAVLAAFDAPSSLDMGPRYDGGRYLARISCGECHGADLEGTKVAPDLSVVSRYSRAAFFDLLRRGIGAHARAVPAMKRLAAIRFHVLEDFEIMALYDYLDARAHAPATLIARASVAAARQRAARETALSNTP